MTIHTILITRPLSQDTEFNDRLHELGYRTIHEPLSEIFLLHDARPSVEQALRDDPDAVILTSQHGANALATLTELRDMFLVCVGEATEYTAQKHGFSRTCSAGGTAARLTNYILDAYDPESCFVYISGRDVQGDLVAELASQNMQVERIIAYEAEAITQLSDTVAEQIRRGQIDMVTFFSARASEIFVDLIKQHGLQEAVASMHSYSLSETVSKPLQQLGWSRMHIAAEPTLASLVECIDNYCTRNKQPS